MRERETERETERQTETETDRQSDRQTDRQRQRETETGSQRQREVNWREIEGYSGSLALACYHRHTISQVPKLVCHLTSDL